MASAQKIGGIEPLPRYIRPDALIPEYEEILEQLHDYHRSLIGSSYYYIRAENERKSLCRIVPGAGKIFFHEIVNHEQHGISEEDLEAAVIQNTGSFSMAGYYPISSHIETKLRVLTDFL
jgi:hypothetical protein